MPLLQAQHRHVRGLRHPGPPRPRENRPRWLRLREPLGTLRPAAILLAGLLRFRLRHGEPQVVAPTLVPPTPQMKRIVFDNWFLMAVAASCALPIRAVGALPVLISREDLLSPALSTHPPARRSRPAYLLLGALTSCGIEYFNAPPSPTSSPLLLPRPHTADTICRRHEYIYMTDTRDAMILTKLSKAQNEVIRIWIPQGF